MKLRLSGSLRQDVENIFCPDAQTETLGYSISNVTTNFESRRIEIDDVSRSVLRTTVPAFGTECVAFDLVQVFGSAELRVPTLFTDTATLAKRVISARDPRPGFFAVPDGTPEMTFADGSTLRVNATDFVRVVAQVDIRSGGAGVSFTDDYRFTTDALPAS